jgi:hypothetical protein
MSYFNYFYDYQLLTEVKEVYYTLVLCTSYKAPIPFAHDLNNDYIITIK